MVKKKTIIRYIMSMMLVFAVVFVNAFAFAGTDSYAASKSKKYYLPTEIQIVDYSEDGYSSLTDIQYDKYGNLTSALISEMIPVKYTIKYKNKKGAISSVTFGDGDVSAKKTYDKKGRLKQVKYGKDTFKFTSNKKSKIKKVTRNGKNYYKVKSIKFHKNGFASKVVYNNGNVNKYNTDGLLTSATVKGGPKFTYSYTKVNGNVVEMIIYRDGQKYKKVTLKYGNVTTKDVWKYSCVICYAGGPSNACELCANNSLSGFNAIF